MEFIVASMGLSIVGTMLAIVNAINRSTKAREIQYRGISSRLDSLIKALKKMENNQ